MDLEGWHPDPFGTHEERFFKQGQPTPLVRDSGVGSYDEPPASVTTATAVPTRAATQATSTPPAPPDNGSSRGPGRSEGDRKKRNPPQQYPNDQPAPPTPVPATKVPAGPAGRSRPSWALGALPRNWWVLVTAVIVVVIIIISVAVVSGKNGPNSGTTQTTAFCIKAPHDTACPDSLLRSQEALLHDFWEAYLTGSACYPQKCPANKAELLLAAASTAKKWRPEVEGGRATTPAARALNNEIAHVLAAANTADESNGQ